MTSAAAVLALSACMSNARVGGSSGTALDVDSTTDSCAVSAAEAPSGTIVFTVVNSADEVTEFYLLADDGRRIVGEVENVAPGAPRTLTVALEPGDYYTACKPGMAGDGVGRAAFTVTDS